jgi:hypothetical protein
MAASWSREKLLSLLTVLVMIKYLGAVSVAQMLGEPSDPYFAAGLGATPLVLRRNGACRVRRKTGVMIVDWRA